MLYTCHLSICHDPHCHDPLMNVPDLLDLSRNVGAPDLPSMICRNARRPVARGRNSLRCQVVRRLRIAYETEDLSEDYRNAAREVVRNTC